MADDQRRYLASLVGLHAVLNLNNYINDDFQHHNGNFKESRPDQRYLRRHHDA